MGVVITRLGLEQQRAIELAFGPCLPLAHLDAIKPKWPGGKGAIERVNPGFVNENGHRQPEFLCKVPRQRASLCNRLGLVALNQVVLSRNGGQLAEPATMTRGGSFSPPLSPSDNGWQPMAGSSCP